MQAQATQQNQEIEMLRNAVVDIEKAAGVATGTMLEEPTLAVEQFTRMKNERDSLTEKVDEVCEH